MGNCVRKGSNKQQDTDHWQSPTSSSTKKSLLSTEPSKEIQKRDVTKDNEEMSSEQFSSYDGKTPRREVKIKITKKQLEELLSIKEMQGLTIEQVLTRLMNGDERVFQSNDKRSWRPALYSIPE